MASRECRRLKDDDSGAFVIAQGSDDDALMTRGDFGCVQFEPLPLEPGEQRTSTLADGTIVHVYRGQDY